MRQGRARVGPVPQSLISLSPVLPIDKYMNNCPQTKEYSYSVSTCQPTCRSLSEVDVTCSIPFVPVDGCTCPEGTFLNDKDHCVPVEECPCYFHGTVVASGEVVMDNGVVW